MLNQGANMWILGLLACIGGGARHEVARVDLAQLNVAALDALTSEEHALSVALTLREGAVAEAQRVEKRVAEAQSLRRQARLEHKTALAALDAARGSGDLYRRGIAEGAEVAAARSVTGAERRLAWQEAARRAAESAVDLADRRIELRRTELEMARYDQLANAGHALGYRRSDFRAQLSSAQVAYDAAERGYEKYAERAEEARQAWLATDRDARAPSTD